MSVSKPCPCCQGQIFEELVDFGEVPHSGTFLRQPKEPFRTVHLSFEFCVRCALIRRRGQIKQVDNDYTLVDRATARQLPEYVYQIIGCLKHLGATADGLIIEVGSNDGTFLQILAQAGFRQLLGVEPSLACAELCERNGYEVLRVHLSQEEAIKIRERYGPAQVVICRHTLEHVFDPLSFLRGMKHLLIDNGILCLEVPDSRNLIQALWIYELWDEHIHSFVPENLASMVSGAGFNVERLEVERHRDSRNILLWGRLKRCEETSTGSLLDCLVDSCRSFTRRWSVWRQNFLSQLEEWPLPITAIGASHPQSNFLLFTGLGRYVSSLIDEDPSKIGRYVPVPSPVPVISTIQSFEKNSPATIIRTAFGYGDWMDKVCNFFRERSLKIVVPYSDHRR